MAAYDILTWSANNRTKKIPSSTNVFDFSSVRIGTDTLTISEASATAFNFNANELQNILTPTLANSAATKGYVDAVATGLSLKFAVIAATAAALPSNTYANGTAGVGATLTAVGNVALGTIDGHTMSPGDRLLVKNEATGANNGIYVVTALGSTGVSPYVLTRSTDADTCQPASNPTIVSGMFMFVEFGSTYAGEGWVLVTPDPITIGTTALTFSQFSQAAAFAAGNGISITSGVIAALIDGNALQFSSGVITLTLNGATLNSGASGLKVSDAGITEVQIASTALGNGLTGGSGTKLAVLAADSTISVGSSGIAVVLTEQRVNDNAGTISAAQIVYIKSSGHVDLAIATTATDQYELGVVKDATIATTGTGAIYEKIGAFVGGFSALTIGAPVYLDRTTAGAVVQSLTGFVAGNFVWRLGYALSATTVQWNPEFVMEY